MGKLTKRRIFKGKLLELYTERRRFPNGYVANLEIVKHPGAVLMVPFLDRKRIVFIRQYRPVVKSTIWELPAGTLNKGEAPLSCAKRELEEEIGYRAKEWKRAGFIYPAPGYTTEKILVFEARGLEKITPNAQADEVIEPRVLAANKIKKLLASGKIVDAKTIAALAMARIL